MYAYGTRRSQTDWASISRGSLLQQRSFAAGKEYDDYGCTCTYSSETASARGCGRANLDGRNGEQVSTQLFQLEADAETVAAYVQALDQTRLLFDQLQQDKVGSLEQFSQIFANVLEKSTKHLGLFRSLYVLEGADSYTYRHSLNVGILCSLIARLLKWDEQQVTLWERRIFA